MDKRTRIPDDFDSPWKDALQRYLRRFLELFFPALAVDVDWSRSYEGLDKEFQQIIRRAKVGKGLADKLFKVWLRDGQEHWLLVHIEVQGEPAAAFPQRMFRYNVAANALYNREVVSIAVLCDTQESWRPSSYAYGRWGGRTAIEFLVVKLLDHLRDLPALAANPNPFAAIVLAHGQALATQHDMPLRREWKLRLIKSLYERGLDADDIRELFRLIDWVMTLPEEMNEALRAEVHHYEEAQTMRYVTSFERLAKKEGREEGRKRALVDGIGDLLKDKFGARGRSLLRKIRALDDVAKLRALLRAVGTATSLDPIRELLDDSANS